MKFEKFLKTKTANQFIHVHLAKKWKVEKEDLGWETALVVHAPGVNEVVKYIEDIKAIGFKTLKKIGEDVIMSGIMGGQLMVSKKKGVVYVYVRSNIVSEWKVKEGYSGRRIINNKDKNHSMVLYV